MKSKKKKKSKKVRLRSGSKTLVIGESSVRITGSINLSLLNAFKEKLIELEITQSEGIRRAISRFCQYSIPKYRVRPVATKQKPKPKDKAQGLIRCERNGKQGYKFGEDGYCYTYKDGDTLAEKLAIDLALEQGRLLTDNDEGSNCYG